MSTLPAQPKALYLITFIQMWEYFSFYGMRVLLVLYMINELQFSDAQAFGIFALYTAMVEFGGILGGMIADRFLGLKKAISLGGWLIALGHLALALGSHTTFFFLGLAFIIAGSSLFSPNLTALLGLQYEQDDSRREAGFTMYYAGVHFGAMLASLLCGYLGDLFGWSYGFGLAAIGMVIGNLTLHFFRRLLEAKGEKKIIENPIRVYASIAIFFIFCIFLISRGMAHETQLLSLAPWICLAAVAYVAHHLLKTNAVRWQKLVKLFVYLMGLSLFFAAEEQLGSSIIMFSDRHASKSLLGIPIPPSVLLSINPAIIILFGTTMNRFFAKLRYETLFPNAPFRIVIPLGITSIAFATLSLSTLLAQNAQSIPLILIIVAALLISFAELMMAPAVYSQCSELTTNGNRGTVMGLLPISFSLASLIGGYLSKLMAIEKATTSQSLEIYHQGFMAFAALLFCAALALGGSLIFILSHSSLSKTAKAIGDTRGVTGPA